MREEKVGFEVARLAKEKGFDVPTLYCFLLDGSEQFSSGDEGDYALYNHNLWDYYSRPTQSLLAKWLREVHNIHVEIRLENSKDYIRFYVVIWGNPKGNHNTSSYTLNHMCDKYEEALETGLFQALKLIK